jgi:hypothetical protein
VCEPAGAAKDSGRRSSTRPARSSTLTVHTLTRPHRGHRISSWGVTRRTPPQSAHLRQTAGSGEGKEDLTRGIARLPRPSPCPLLTTAALAAASL